MSWGNAFRYLQKNIFDYTLDTKNINTLLAVLEARRDNTTIVEADVVSEPGKKRPLKINFFAPRCEDDGECTDTVCDAGTALAPVQDWFEINQCTASAVYKLNKDDIRLVDGNYQFSDFALSSIRSVFPTVREKLSTDVAAMIVAEVGVLTDGNSSRAVSIMDASTAGMNPLGFYQIQREYQNSGYSGKMPYIIGGSVQVDNWQKSTALATVNTTIGIDMGRARPMGNLYYDQLINDTFADASQEHIISFSPDMLKFVSYSENAGIFATDVTNIRAIDAMYQRGYPSLVNGGLVDPRTGLLWDLDILFVPCDSVTGKPAWTFKWKINWDIFFMQPRVCNIPGLNSIFHFTTCLEQAPICGDNPYPSAATATTRTGDASGLTYPLVIQKIEIGTLGVVFNMPNEPTSVANIGELRDLLNESQGSITFAVSGSNLTYSGFTNNTLTINEGTPINFS